MEAREVAIIQRTIDRLKSIVGGPPFEVRDKLREFTKTLEEVISSNKEGSGAAPSPKE